MLATIKIEELTRTSFVQPAHQGYNTAYTNSGNIKLETGSSNSMADKPIDTTTVDLTETDHASEASTTTVVQTPVSASAGNRELDQILVVRAQQGDKKAFGMLVEKYHRKLGRLLGRMIRDQAEVEDGCKKALLKPIVRYQILEAIARFTLGCIGLALIPQKITWFQWGAGHK